MKDPNEIFWCAYGILKEREAYWNASKKNEDAIRATCYSSAAEIVRAAIDGDWEVINQFSYD